MRPAGRNVRRQAERLMAGVRMAWKIARSAAMQQPVQSVFLWTEAMMASDRLPS